MTDYPLAAANPEKLDEIVREAESLLAAQLQIAIAADQRAMTFSGLLIAASAAIASSLWSGRLPLLGVYMAVTILALLLASALCAMMSARPTPWQPVGNRPANWLEDVLADDDFHEGKAAMAHYYDGMIVENDARLSRASTLIRISMSTAALALAIGAGSTASMLPPPPHTVPQVKAGTATIAVEHSPVECHPATPAGPHPLGPSGARCNAGGKGAGRP